MIEQLFGSKTRVKLLQLFLGNPNRAFYVREITRKIDEQINSVRRELANLLSIVIISSETNNNRLYYEVDQKYEYYKPLEEIFGNASVSKSVKQTTSKLNDPIHAIGNVELAIFTGQFTRDETSGVDILIVGDVNKTQLSKYIDELERKEGKELRYTVLPRNEFEYRRQVNDRFIALVLNSKINVVVDKNNLTDKEAKTSTKNDNDEE
jgi:predicted transcriptional regulator